MPLDVFIRLEDLSVSDLIRHLSSIDLKSRPVLVEGSNKISLSVSDQGDCLLKDSPLRITVIK